MNISRRGFVRAAAVLTAGASRGFPLAMANSPAVGYTGADSIRAHAEARGLLYGCAVDVAELAADANYAALVREQTNILVPEIAMKWAIVRPNKATFNFEQADALMEFASVNHKQVRGTTLAWYRSLPKWLTVSATPDNTKALLTDHIQRVMGRYAGRIHSWDVVNEAVLVADGRPDRLRNSLWLKMLGPDYIDITFRAAREADAKALLTYNDYGIEYDDEESVKKREGVLTLLRGLRDRNVPIDAVGIQSHVGMKKTNWSGFKSFLAECRKMDLQVLLTELDVNDRAQPADPTIRDAAVADVYKSYLDATLAEPAVRAVITWGITDKYTSMDAESPRDDHQPQRCLPFDEAYRPVKAFFALRNALDARSV